MTFAWRNWQTRQNDVRAQAKRGRFRPQIERLEDRTVPSVSLGVHVTGIPGTSSFCGCLPPDTNGAPGPLNVVEIVNTAMEITDKSGALLSGPTSLPTFFSGHGFTVNSLSDPVILFDESVVNASGPNGRFIVVILDFTSANATDFLDFAVSVDADATHGFTNFRHINVGETSFFADQPRLGMNADAYFVQFNMFFTSIGTYAHPQIFTIQKSDFLTGGLTTFHHDMSSSLFSIDPANMHGATTGGPEYFMTEGATLGQLAVIKETNVLSNTPTDATTNLSIATYNQPPAAPQPSGTVTTNDSRMMNAAWRNNILVSAHTVGTGSPNTAHARWYQVDTTSTPTLTQTGEIAPGPGVATYFPSIDIDSNNDLGMTYIESSTSEFVSMYVTGRTPSDPAGTMETGVRSSAGTTSYTGSRMGDYSGTSVDPANTTIFWSENEFITSSSAGAWATGIASFSVATASVATHLAFSVQPSNTVAGQSISPAVTVQALDASNNLVTGDNSDQVTMSIGTNPGAGTLSGTLTVTVQNGVATFSNLSIDKAGTGYTLQANAPGLTGATSNTFNITAAAANHLSFAQQPTDTTAGQAISPAVTVQILDAFNNLTNSTATVTMSVQTGPGSLGGTTSVAASGGVATFNNLVLQVAGNYTLAASGTGLTGATSNSFIVSAAAADHLAFGQQPTNTSAGQTITPAVTVQILDAFNNLTGSTASVTVSIASGPIGSTLNGTTTVSASGGVATFGDLSIAQTGTYTLGASSIGLGGATSNSFVISGTVASFRVAGFPSPVAAGTAGTFTVTALDSSGNTVTSYAGTVHFTSSDGQAALPGDSTLTNGTGSFTATLKTAGSQSLTATDTVNASITGTQTGIVVNPGKATHFAIAAPPSVVRDTTFTITVTAQDAFNNTATGFTGTARFSSSDKKATLPKNYGYTAADAGVHSFSVSLHALGNQTITVTSQGNVSGTVTILVTSPAFAPISAPGGTGPGPSTSTTSGTAKVADASSSSGNTVPSVDYLFALQTALAQGWHAAFPNAPLADMDWAALFLLSGRTDPLSPWWA